MSLPARKQDPSPLERLAAQVAEACSIVDAKRIEEIVGSIGATRTLSVSARVNAIQEILAQRADLNNVAVSGVHQLRALDLSACATTCRIILAEPLCEEREYVHGSAIVGLIESGAFVQKDIATLAECLSHRYSHIRTCCQRAIRDLDRMGRCSLMSLVESSPNPRGREIVLFVQALSPPVSDLALSDLRIAGFRPQTKPGSPRSHSRSGVSSRMPRVAQQEEPGKIRKTECAESEAKAAPPSHSEIGHDVRDSMQLFRRLEFERRPLGALCSTASRTNDSKEYMAACAEIVSRFGPAAAHSVAKRLVFFLSDPAQRSNRVLNLFADKIAACGCVSHS